MSAARGPSRRPPLWLLGALLAFLLGAEELVRVTPLFEAPDENSHADYLGLVLWSGETPLVRGTAERAGRPGWLQTALGHHPPLYYRLLAAGLELAGHHSLSVHADFGRGRPPARVAHGADELHPVSPAVRRVRWLRRVSILCGLVTLLAIHRTLRLVAPADPRLADLGVLLLATNGGFLRTHAVLDNGNLSLALGALLTWGLAGAVARERLGLGPGLALGALAGAALATKLTALVGPVALVAAGAWIAWRRSGRPWRLPLGAWVALALALVLWAPWVARNLALYGEPLATGVHEATYAASVLPAEERWRHLCFGLPRGLWLSGVGSIGWGLGGAPAWLGALAAGLVLLALAGWVVGGRRVRLDPGPAFLVALVGTVALALVVRFNLVFAQPQARYAYGALPLVAGLAGGGLWALARRLPAGLRPVAGAALVVTLAGAEFGFLRATAGAFAPVFEPERERPIVSLDLHGPPRAVVAPPPELIDRPDGPPLVRWRAGDARWSAVFWVDGGARYGGTFEALGRALGGNAAGLGEFAIPSPIWSHLAPGRELSVALRRLPTASGERRSVGTGVARVRR